MTDDFDRGFAQAVKSKYDARGAQLWVEIEGRMQHDEELRKAAEGLPADVVSKLLRIGYVYGAQTAHDEHQKLAVRLAEEARRIHWADSPLMAQVPTVAAMQQSLQH